MKTIIALALAAGFAASTVAIAQTTAPSGGAGTTAMPSGAGTNSPGYAPTTDPNAPGAKTKDGKPAPSGAPNTATGGSGTTPMPSGASTNSPGYAK